MELIINDRIRNRKIEFFNSFRLSLKYNSIASTFSFDFLFDPDVFELKEVACIGHYHICTIKHLDQTLITGIVLSEGFNSSSVKSLVSIGGYSITGVLEDCNFPTNSAIDAAIAKGNLKIPSGQPIPYVPLQFDGLSLRSIAERILAPFKLKMVIDPAVASKMDEKFSETNAEPKDTIKQYLTELATQKGINLTHDEFGRVLFTRVKTDLKPIMEFDVPNGGLPGTNMKLVFNGQAMHSQITVMAQADDDSTNASEATVDNPYVYTIFRPKTTIQSSGTDVDTDLAAKNARADELKGLSLTITIDRWDINESIIKPNNLVRVRNPECYLFNFSNWFIESIDYAGDQKEMTAVLHCVLPSVYDGSEPKYLFAGINLH